jgi:ketosteroid isomerase-like protein
VNIFIATQVIMKRFAFLLAISSTIQAYAQKNIEGLINAEKSFAAYSVSHSTKEAFLKFLDSTGVVFEKALPVNGIESWNKKEKTAGILNWHPQFAEIAASNDLGYTTGPWTYQPQTLQDSIIAKGQFTTVWHTDKNGEWKVLVDLGTSNIPSVDAQEAQKINASKITTQPIDLASLVKTEEAFIKAYSKNSQSAYKKFLSAQSILNRHKNLPATTGDQQDKIIETTPPDIRFTINHSGIATSGDLGFVYGTIRLNDKTENYLHIWRREKEGWKIALEVLRY